MKKRPKIEEIPDPGTRRFYGSKPPPREITRQEMLKKLWIDFLRISPSYEKARKAINGETDCGSLTQSIGEFDVVLRTFNDFGDVWRAMPSAVDQWTQKKLFQATLLDPNVREIAAIAAMDIGDREQINNKMTEYLDSIRPNSGMHGSLILAIPPHLSKRDLLVQISNLLNTYHRIHEEHDEITPKPKAKYECQVSKLREAAIRQSLEAVILRADNPNWPIWKIGAALNLHPIAAQDIENAEALIETIPEGRKRLNKKDNAAGAKILMNSLVSRCFKRAFLLSENAAKGKFPCVDAILDTNGEKLEAHFDYETIHKKLTAYREKYPELIYPENRFARF